MSSNHDSEYIPSDGDYDGDDMECSNSYASDDSNDDVPLNDVTSEAKSYIILKEDDLIRCQQDEINKVTSTILSISNDDALMLLLKYKWRVTTIYDDWFGDEVKVRESIGMLDVDHDVKFPKINRSIVNCGICFDSVMVKDTANCGCGHVFCKECWISYVSTAINDGPGCLSLKCPEPSCGAAVGPDMVKVLVGEKEKKKYDRFWLGSYVENNEKIKWCPSPGCDYAVEFNDNDDSNFYDVRCDCKYVFCWKCAEDDAHSPLDCETVGKWVLKNTAEAENTNWILAYTKPCPKCKKSIEKNAGCMHMSCRCGCQFCWLCLGPWNRHDGTACNRFREVGKVNVREQQREFAKKSIERYTHYYERWAANEKSRKQALSDLHHKFQPHIQPLSVVYGQPESKFQFITEAWLQIVECRRVLKWTYAYGYYIPIHEEDKKKFFEYRQGEAESALERLHYCAEKELPTYIQRRDKEAATLENLHNFSLKLTELTKTTQTFFKNLVRALENDLSVVDDYDLSLARALENDLSEVNDYDLSENDDYDLSENDDYDLSEDDDDELSYQWVFFDT